MRPATDKSQRALATPISLTLVVLLACLTFVFAAPYSSSSFSEYIYNYEANINCGPNGFKFKAKAHLEHLYLAKSDQDSGQLVRLRLSKPVFYSSNDDQQPLAIDTKQISPEHDLYAKIVHINGTAHIKALYTHQADQVTLKNIKKSILVNLLPTSHHRGQSTGFIGPLVDHNDVSQPELFSPDSISSVSIIAKAKNSNKQAESSSYTTNAIIAETNNVIYQSVEGYQNVTFRSRVFSHAESNLTTDFQLNLVDELKSNAHESFDKAESISAAIKLIDRSYQTDSIGLERERKIRSNSHSDRSLAELSRDYTSALGDESLASIDAAVAFLRLLDKVRDEKNSHANELLDILKRLNRQQGQRSSFLDILAAARTKESISAALKYLKLPKNDDLDTAERFLSVLSVAVKTAAKMHSKRALKSAYYFSEEPALRRGRPAKEQLAKLASAEFIAKEFLNVLKQTAAKKWASQKLRWSTLLTLATLVNAYNQERNFVDMEEDELNKEVSKLLLGELKSCHKTDADCRIVILQAIGNVGLLADEQFLALKEHIFNSGRRESISAMRVMRDLLQVQAKDKPLSQKFYTELKSLLLKAAYSEAQETTARVLAAEMIVRFIPNSLASEELLRHLPSFGNTELATMIYSRMQSLKPDSLAKHNDNWYWKSCIINGTSTSFVQSMAKTEKLTASYGVNVELLNKGKILKESTFDVFLDTEKRTQDLFSLGIFARGLSSFAGGSNDGSEDESESTMAGMTLRLLGGYLRPYIFFTGTGELMSHVWSGVGSEPTTAFNGDLLLIDHDEGYPLISGFVAEQQMRGVLSIDVTGKVTISIWKRNSHSVVRTKAAVIVQASHSVFTSFDFPWQSHLLSFGGQALIDFVADLDFYSSPFKICLQVTQPDFIVRYNERRYNQSTADKVHKKLVRRNFNIGAKSYSLNSENNLMCSLMNDEL